MFLIPYVYILHTVFDMDGLYDEIVYMEYMNVHTAFSQPHSSILYVASSADKLRTFFIWIIFVF